MTPRVNPGALSCRSFTRGVQNRARPSDCQRSNALATATLSAAISSSSRKTLAGRSLGGRDNGWRMALPTRRIGASLHSDVRSMRTGWRFRVLLDVDVATAGKLALVEGAIR